MIPELAEAFAEMLDEEGYLPPVQRPEAPRDFQSELRRTINRHSMENRSNTPDFMLAEYLIGCLDLWDTTVRRRDDWYGRAPDPCSAGLPDTAPASTAKAG
jgi:hypothetical protein